jgi:hypothetical protein
VGTTDARDNGNSPRVVVSGTRTGQAIASIAGAKGTAYIGASGAADGRTFAIGTTIWPAPNAAGHPGQTTGPTGWYLLRIDPAAPGGARLMRLPIPATARDSSVYQMALSPAGRELAVLSDPGRTAAGEGWLRVFSVGTGRLLRAWVITDPAVASGVSYIHDLAWVHGDSGLAFTVTTERDGVPSPTEGRIDVRTVDVATGSADGSAALAAAAAAGQPYPGAASLLSDSRVVWWQHVTVPPYGNFPLGAPVLCAGATLTADGASVLCVASYFSKDEHSTLLWLAYPVSGPGTARVIARLPVPQSPKGATPSQADAAVVWASADGRTVLAYWHTAVTGTTTPVPTDTYNIGVATGGRLAPLPPNPAVQVR